MITIAAVTHNISSSTQHQQQQHTTSVAKAHTSSSTCCLHTVGGAQTNKATVYSPLYYIHYLTKHKTTHITTNNATTTTKNFSLFLQLATSASIVMILLLGLVPLNPILWYYVWHYVWHDVWLNIVINKFVLLLSVIMITWIFIHYHIVYEMHSMWFMWKVTEDINYKFFVNSEFSS